MSKKSKTPIARICRCGTLVLDGLFPPCLECKGLKFEWDKKEVEEDPWVRRLAPLCDTIIEIR